MMHIRVVSCLQERRVEDLFLNRRVDSECVADVGREFLFPISGFRFLELPEPFLDLAMIRLQQRDSVFGAVLVLRFSFHLFHVASFVMRRHGGRAAWRALWSMTFDLRRALLTANASRSQAKHFANFSRVMWPVKNVRRRTVCVPGRAYGVLEGLGWKVCSLGGEARCSRDTSTRRISLAFRHLQAVSKIGRIHPHTRCRLQGKTDSSR